MFFPLVCGFHVVGWCLSPTSVNMILKSWPIGEFLGCFFKFKVAVFFPCLDGQINGWSMLKPQKQLNFDISLVCLTCLTLTDRSNITVVLGHSKKLFIVSFYVVTWDAPPTSHHQDHGSHYLMAISEKKNTSFPSKKLGGWKHPPSCTLNVLLNWATKETLVGWVI